ncbi:MAG: ABC transporter substrate-binding protein [bacterium]|nr:ABC transporter substrate-binding protein [bacterium]
MTVRWQRALAMVVIAGLIVAMAGCVAKPGTPATSDRPVTGGVLTFVQGADPVTLDVHRTTEFMSYRVTSQIYENLIMLGTDGTPKPGLAESWQMSPDGLSCTLKLRQGVKFTDGTVFDAAAVQANVDRILKTTPALPARRLLADVKNLEVIDAHTIRFDLSKPLSLFPYYLSHPSVGMISPRALSELVDQLPTTTVGTGPFVLKEWVPKDRVILNRNEDYWGQPAWVDQVIFRPAPEAATRTVMLESGEADIVANVPPAMVSRLRANPAVEVLVAPYARVTFIALNNYRGITADPKVRQALNHAVDKQAILERILFGIGVVSDAPVASGVEGYSRVGTYQYNVARARQLLAEAGVAPGTKVTFFTPSGRYLMDYEIAQAVQGYLTEVGLDVSLETLEWAAFLSNVSKVPDESIFDLALLSFAPGTNDPDWHYSNMFHSASWAPKSNNRCFFADPRVDELLELARQKPSAAERAPLYEQVNKIVFDLAPWIFLHEEQQIYGLSLRVQGVEPAPTEMVYLKDAWLKVK